MTTKKTKESSRDLLFSVSAKELIFQSFTVGGAGGQGRDHVNTGVRLIHPASGARGEGRDDRKQLNNKKAALRKLAASPQFLYWVHQRVQEIDREQTIEQWVDEQMANLDNFKVEYKDEAGNWVEVE